jgi:hypothetical protein
VRDEHGAGPSAPHAAAAALSHDDVASEALARVLSDVDIGDVVPKTTKRRKRLQADVSGLGAAAQGGAGVVDLASGQVVRLDYRPQRHLACIHCLAMLSQSVQDARGLSTA